MPDSIAQANPETAKGKKLYSQLGTNLGIGLSDIIKILSPELIILSGGLSKPGS